MKVPIWLRVINSPFKLPKLKWYFGKITMGVPYFLPRKWVKATPKTAEEASLKEIERVKKHNAKEGTYKLSERGFDEIYERYLHSSFAQPLKFGFSSCGLGWKTKFDSFRFEWSPRLSFVAFGHQVCVTVVAPHLDHYWECFLAYHYDTDKTKSRKERIEEAKEKHPCIWTSYKNNEEKETTDYWTKVIK